MNILRSNFTHGNTKLQEKTKKKSLVLKPVVFKLQRHAIHPEEGRGHEKKLIAGPEQNKGHESS